MRRGPYRGLPWAIAALALAFACMAALVLGLAGALPAHAAADEPLRAGSLQAQEPSSATNDWLGELRFGTRTDPSDERFAGYELEPELDAAVHEYTLYVPDTEGGIYAWGTSLLASSTTSMSTDAVYAAFTDSRGNEQDVNLGAYGSSGSFVYLTRCISRGSSTNELRIYSPGGTADYTVHVRRVASLSSLVAQVAGQESELFSSGATEFDLPVPLNCKGEVLTLTAQPYFPPTAGANDDYVVKIAGEEVQAGEAWTHVLEGGAEDIAVEVSYEGNRSTAYTVHVMPTDTGGAARFSFEVEEEGQEPPVDAEVKVFNAHGVQVMPDESDPTHFSGLFVGSEYTYTASAEGWRSVRGSFTAQSGESPVAVLFAERSKGRYLDDLRVYPNSSGSVAGNYPLRRAEELDASFDATVYAVSYSSQQTSNACYLSAVLSDNAPEGARIRVSAWGLDGEEHSMVLPDSTEDLPVRRSLGKNIFQQGPKRAVYWIEVGIGDDVERYAVVVERDLQLAGLSVTDETGMGNLIEQPFQRSVHDYDVSVLKSVPFLLVTAAPYEGLEGAQVLVDGMEAGGTAFVELYEERLQDVRVELEYDETYDDPALAGLAYTSTGLYTVHVERLVPVDVTIVTDPEDAIACVYDRKGDRVQSAGDGRTFLGLYEGREYTYSVTRYGCKGEKGTFVAEDGLVVHVTLDSAETVHPELEGMEWWNYRNNYENNGTTQATTPDSPANAALKWQVSIGGDYGSSATPPLVGNGFVFTAAGKFIYKLAIVGVVVAVLAVVGVGMFIWHEQPSFCSTMCHIEDTYVNNYMQEQGTTGTDKYGNEVSNTNAIMSVLHRNTKATAKSEIVCVDCHVPNYVELAHDGLNFVQGNYAMPRDERTLARMKAWDNEPGETFCANENCHVYLLGDDGMLSYDKLEASTKTRAFNPHEQHHENLTLDCSACHKGHRASTVVCTGCHQHEDIELPDGWVTYEESEAIMKEAFAAPSAA